ncbi:serine hydrolase domain-containing protein [Xylanimonas protaetiae]|uniref:Class C beta-lactamase-related serine hydrolase n=1 Tax=Xylanimonas protaetiae TaxID=2509457 RepID=A0A4P6F4X0_9MICO|nr:serine hydrolase [Xylanimonas protaetiae]QAY69783.1 class C beta-lactamase-related serine hydrolase [Xylanimonas protaetiae]
MTETWRRLPRTSPEAAGIDRTGITQLVDALGPLGAHSLLVLRHGNVVAEQVWAPHTFERPHQMYSVSKTFTAMAVGLAVAEGLLTVEDRVVDLLPDAAPDVVSDHLAAMRVKHLLTMASGHAGDLMSVVDEPGTGDDWPRALLAADVPMEPGSRFVYNTGATYLLSAILHRLTEQRLLDYLTPRVLAPIGIRGATWEQDPRGIDMGGFGLSITTEDMAAFGQLLLQRGRWGSAQLIPAAWVDEATAVHVDNSPQGWGPEASAGYGYQMWRCTSGAVRADGAHGQFIVLWPEHDVVVAITSGAPQMHDELTAVWTCLGPALGPSDPETLPDGDAVGGGPAALAMPSGTAWEAVGDKVDGRTFRLDADAFLPGAPPEVPPVRTVTVRRDGDVVLLDAGPMQGRAAYGAWGDEQGEELGLPSASTYAWTAERTLEVRLAGLGTPFVWTVRLTFTEDDTVEVAIDQNVAFGPTELVRATAR